MGCGGLALTAHLSINFHIAPLPSILLIGLAIAYKYLCLSQSPLLRRAIIVDTLLAFEKRQPNESF